MLSRASRLNTKAFAQAFAGGKTARHPLLSVRVWHRLDEKIDSSGDNGVIKTVRAAFVVPKKQAKAAKRNLLRRRMRECYRQHPALSQRERGLQFCDLIFVSTPAAHNASWDELHDAFAQLLRRAARLAEPPKSSQNESVTNESKPLRF